MPLVSDATSRKLMLLTCWAEETAMMKHEHIANTLQIHTTLIRTLSSCTLVTGVVGRKLMAGTWGATLCTDEFNSVQLDHATGTLRGTSAIKHAPSSKKVKYCYSQIITHLQWTTSNTKLESSKAYADQGTPIPRPAQTKELPSIDGRRPRNSQRSTCADQ